ncbi:hypothetical protein FA13DRAFT_1711077 [Coprinellus micaceus]|uniref:Uncharacterized protein n=1 Tax=Coprinellus micaceus TaxID=71717 RepID=A0A4Y7T632_COPMI|nr:hypothetical protein FA13DRAFT_1711077 [Coprinellus micaceus]
MTLFKDLWRAEELRQLASRDLTLAEGQSASVGTRRSDGVDHFTLAHNRNTLASDMKRVGAQATTRPQRKEEKAASGQKEGGRYEWKGDTQWGGVEGRKCGRWDEGRPRALGWGSRAFSGCLLTTPQLRKASKPRLPVPGTPHTCGQRGNHPACFGHLDDLAHHLWTTSLHSLGRNGDLGTIRVAWRRSGGIDILVHDLRSQSWGYSALNFEDLRFESSGRLSGPSPLPRTFRALQFVSRPRSGKAHFYDTCLDAMAESSLGVHDRSAGYWRWRTRTRIGPRAKQVRSGHPSCIEGAARRYQCSAYARPRGGVPHSKAGAERAALTHGWGKWVVKNKFSGNDNSVVGGGRMRVSPAEMCTAEVERVLVHGKTEVPWMESVSWADLGLFAAAWLVGVGLSCRTAKKGSGGYDARRWQRLGRRAWTRGLFSLTDFKNNGNKPDSKGGAGKKSSTATARSSVGGSSISVAPACWLRHAPRAFHPEISLLQRPRRTLTGDLTAAVAWASTEAGTPLAHWIEPPSTGPVMQKMDVIDLAHLFPPRVIQSLPRQWRDPYQWLVGVLNPGRLRRDVDFLGNLIELAPQVGASCLKPWVEFALP